MRGARYSILAAAGVAATMASAGRADLIDLRDGRHLSGTMTRQGDVMVIKADDGSVVTAKPDDVVKVTLTGSATPAEAAASEWARVAQQIKTADDLQTVIKLQQKYLDKYPSAANAGDVKAAQAGYQALAEGNAVKFRGRWVAKAQIDVILRAWTDAARPAAELYRAGRMKEALEAAKAVLDTDKENPDALTVAGLAAYRSGNLPQARTHFTSLAAVDPGNVLAENNLAVVCFGQKQMGEGIAHYGKALQIMPENRLLLDNILEAINAYTVGNGDKNGAAFKALQKQFENAENRMESQMAAKRQVRYGSTWIDQREADRLAANQKKLQEQYDQLSTQFATARSTMARLEAQIQEADAEFNTAQVNISIANAQILLAQQRGVVALEFLAARDLAVQEANHLANVRSQYQAQHDQLMASSRDLLAQGEKVKAALDAAAPRYAGTQRIMDLGEADDPPPPAPPPGA